MDRESNFSAHRHITIKINYKYNILSVFYISIMYKKQNKPKYLYISELQHAHKARAQIGSYYNYRKPHCTIHDTR